MEKMRRKYFPVFCEGEFEFNFIFDGQILNLQFHGRCESRDFFIIIILTEMDSHQCKRQCDY